MTLEECLDAYLHELLDGHRPDEARCNAFGTDARQLYTILWSFTQCMGIPSLEFDKTTHTVRDWFTLCGPAVQAAIERCPGRRGFVNLGWDGNKGGHSSLLYFDANGSGRQVFFDPSGWCGRGIFHTFKKNHLWGDEDAERVVVDYDSVMRSNFPNLQSFFEPDRDEDGGCCTSVCFLVLVCCLRFGCTDMQEMSDAMRKCMTNRNYSGDDRLTFVRRLYTWHRSLHIVGRTPSRLELLQLCKIRVPKSHSPCGAVLESTRLCCWEKPCPGWALCRLHLEAQFGVPACALEHPVTHATPWAVCRGVACCRVDDMAGTCGTNGLFPAGNSPDATSERRVLCKE